MILAILTATSISIAPELSRTCELIAARLYVDQSAGRITHTTASKAFERCQRRYPVFSPDQPAPVW